ncbi:hypothetical protein NC653_002716 [Populus alba x Populus x berolinensis]|uniref:Uncharacterized protein n=1 Tax=Populus alba x Populus x berolinensis TaxID=444605 RepID=A0AAD6RPL6_9ROSI|nr:hypothetical protein NC653_002716 [Populus alba x Populus x berolinensis]
MPRVKNPPLDDRSETFSFLSLPKLNIIQPPRSLQILNDSSSSTRSKLVLAMETLTSLSAKVFTKNNKKTLSPSRSALLGRSDFVFSPSPNLKRLHLII